MFGFAKKLVKQAEGIIAPEIQSTQPTYGFRVLQVEPDSEAFHAKIEPFFDYIIAANGVRFQSQYYGDPETKGAIAVEQEQSPADEFEKVVKSTEGRLVLEIWCAKGKSTRIVTLPKPSESPSGISVRWSQLSVADHVWHVLNVAPSSPADKAGLISHADYIIAAEDGLLDNGGESLLGKVVSRASPTEGILFYVYNREYDVVRPVRVHPSFDGKLGCGVGYGFLHALPAVSGQGRSAPGSTLFDDRDSVRESSVEGASSISSEPAHFLDSSVHAPMPSTAAPPPAVVPPPKAPVSRVNAHHHSASHSKTQIKAAQADLSDYFNEQSQISHEIDGSSGAKAGSAVPPPPTSKAS